MRRYRCVRLIENRFYNIYSKLVVNIIDIQTSYKNSVIIFVPPFQVTLKFYLGYVSLFRGRFVFYLSFHLIYHILSSLLRL